MPLKVDLNYSHEHQQHLLSIGDGKYTIQFVFGSDKSVHDVAKSIEATTNNFTLTTSHRDIYKSAYENLDKKYLKQNKELNQEKENYKALLADHLELLGVIKK